MPLSVSDLRTALDPDASLPYLAYHVSVLAQAEDLINVGDRPNGASIVKLYSIPTGR